MAKISRREAIHNLGSAAVGLLAVGTVANEGKGETVETKPKEAPKVDYSKKCPPMPPSPRAAVHMARVLRRAECACQAVIDDGHEGEDDEECDCRLCTDARGMK